MKDKNYKSTRGAGDGDLTSGLLGMMKGGGAMEYPAMMKAQTGGDKIKKIEEKPPFVGSPPTKSNKKNRKAIKKIKKAFKGIGRAK
tara:strand:- start:1126 stop:1383 length:258 start_codon:yes stop_codon:yes gene_type:complete